MSVGLPASRVVRSVPFWRIWPTANERQQHRDVRRAADRPVGDPLHEQADDDRADDHDRHRGRERQPGAEAEDRDVGRDHHQVAVGEVDEPQDPEDHRQPDRHERVQAARAQRVDDLLDDVVGHVATPPTPR